MKLVSRFMVFGVAVLGGLSMVGATVGRAEAHQPCKKVHGHITTQITAENCDSPVLLCTTGTVTGGGMLHGATAFTTLGLAPGAGLSPVVPATTLSYTGNLTLTTRRGALALTDVGLLEQGTLRFTELDSVVSGTGDFAGNSGHWFISGFVTGGGTGFDGEIEGDLCEE
jgi:hypothetical protein